MKLALLTNMPSAHQMYLGEQLAKVLGEDNFRLVFAEPTSEAREEMGWEDKFDAPYVIRMWQSTEAKKEVLDWIENADVIVQGRVPMSLVRKRIREGKLTFAYQERFWKRGFSWPRAILRLPRIWRRYWSVQRPNYHLLAAGAYVASDLAKIACFRGRAWKFGYFLDASDLPVKQPSSTLKLLWCARFSPVKRAKDAVSILARLRERGVDCSLTMIGDGEERIATEQFAREKNQAVTFLGWQSEKEVEIQMQKADILLMTSGFGEGWGMVINEAIRAGCVVVANRQIGAAPWLVQNNNTGFLYDSEFLSELIDRLESLDHQRLREMSERALKLHDTQWSSEVAASRLVELSGHLLDKRDGSACYQEGVCSPSS